MVDFAKVPPSFDQRQLIEKAVKEYVRQQKLEPPLTLDQLKLHGVTLLEKLELGLDYFNYVVIYINNACWQKYLAAIPISRRTLLLPPCLRDPKKCPAKFDQLGLLCQQCGLCPLGDLQQRAEDLGYAVIIAEGNSIVTRLINKGMIDAVIGVGCLKSLESAFEAIAKFAVPALALPLTKDGCQNTDLDIEPLLETLAVQGGDFKFVSPNINKIKKMVQDWFSKANLTTYLESAIGNESQMAIDSITKDGKRWRPLLAVMVAQTIAANEYDLETLKSVSIAVECFHKASLIHDDIEDNDDFRNNLPTLHSQAGIPTAINVGDWLIGIGYQLLVNTNAKCSTTTDFIKIASEAHGQMCQGQQLELAWSKNPSLISLPQLLEIFTLKTSAAFEVSLRLGAYCAEAPLATHKILHEFSQYLGILYQINDDLDDLVSADFARNSADLRPTIWLALLSQSYPDFVVEYLNALKNKSLTEVQQHQMLKLAPKTEEEIKEIKDSYYNKIVATVAQLDDLNMRLLLIRLTNKIITRG